MISYRCLWAHSAGLAGLLAIRPHSAQFETHRGAVPGSADARPHRSRGPPYCFAARCIRQPPSDHHSRLVAPDDSAADMCASPRRALTMGMTAQKRRRGREQSAGPTMTSKSVRSEIWLAAFVAATVCLALTSTNAIVEAPHNNSDGAPPDAQADIISRASAAAPAPNSGHNSSTDALPAPPAEIVSARDMDQAIYYWVHRTRDALRRNWARKPHSADTPGIESH